LSYIAAVRRLDTALRAFASCGIPMDPGSVGPPAPWTREHVGIITEVADAFTDVISRRRDWDRLRAGGHRPAH
jgi:hypothetical protein